MSNYASNNDPSQIKNANENINNYSESVYQLIGIIEQPQVRDIATTYENELDNFLKNIEIKIMNRQKF